MAAYAALVSLLNNIEQMMTHPNLSTSFHNYQIHSLEKKAALLLHFIETFNYGGVSEEAQHLESLITSAAHTAEDMIESHIVNQLLPLSADDREADFSFSLYLRKKGEIEDQFHGGSNQAIEEPAPYVAGDGCLDYLRQIIEDMDAIIQKANELNEKHRFREDQPPTPSTPKYAQTKEESGMVGFGDELIQLLDELTGQRSNLHTISIVGMGGMGKTTLAKNIYAHQLIIERFDIRAWATVSHQYNAKQILQQLLSHKDNSDKDVDELGEQLHKTLFGRRYLIILDDIWCVEAWDEVSRFFPDNGNGSRIVLTTRLSDVAKDCGSSCFPKNLLNENESWELFCKKAFQNEDCPTELEKVGRKIVRLCKGLALSIVVIGGRLLKSPRTVGYWKNVAKDIELSPNSKEKEESLDVLFSSYNHLPSHLKPCFLHIGVLKRIYANLHISRIIQLWVSEGFLKSNGGRFVEEIAEDYLKELIDRNLILVEKRSKNGRMKCCDIHDLLRDLCLKVAEQQGFFHVISQGHVVGTKRRLVFNNASWGRKTAKLPLARSIMECEFHKNSYKHRLLRILDANNHRSVEVPVGCVNLRYLALREFGSVGDLELPSSLSLVWNLHALIIKSSSWSLSIVVAPVEIWKMQKLRHIECLRIYLPQPDGQDELLILENLQTLGNVVNLRLSEDVCKIIPNIKKLHLDYHRYLQGWDDSLMECLCNLDRLHKLESLKLSCWLAWFPQDYKLNKILAFPSSLNMLTLSSIDFDWDDLTMIGSLPLLEVLNLERSYLGKGSTWSPVDGQFQRLKFLKIHNCWLRFWNADSCHFPILEKLLLLDIDELEEIPWGIGEIPTLKLIRVVCCSNSAAISAIKIKDEQLECYGNDDLQIQVDVNKRVQQSFMAMVEKEGLTLNHVQFNIYPFSFYF